MALVILVGACHVVVVRGNFLWTSTDKSRGEEGTKEAERMAVQVVEFSNGVYKIRKILHKNQHTQRKIIEF